MTPRPTVFISYASEDREAVLRLREALTAAGVDVWYDANELGGGDAWDQKIRRQIRECDYFMPVVSATTERRKEGYFRREWRLAAERTLDMADDVMFLLPVSIDGTGEAGARVPEKFLTVQWLQVPGGEPTPALTALAQRLAAGDHSLPPKVGAPPLVNRPPKVAPGGPAPADHPEGPPPMPAFPHLAQPANFGSFLKFLAEVLWWVITAGWLLLRRAPRWLRVVIAIWFCIWLLSTCNRNDRNDRPPGPAIQLTGRDEEEARKAFKATVGQLAALGAKAGAEDGSGQGNPLSAIGSQIARSIATEIKVEELKDKAVLAVPFALGVTDPAQAEFLAAVFTPLYGRLAVEHAGETALVTELSGAATTETLAALGRRLNAGHVLGAELATEAGETFVTVRLVRALDATVAWSGRYPLAGSDAAVVAADISAGVLAVVPE